MKNPGYLYRRRIISSIYSKVETDNTLVGHHGHGRFANVRIEGLTLRDATTWTAVVEKVANYTVYEVKVLNHHNATVYKVRRETLRDRDRRKRVTTFYCSFRMFTSMLMLILKLFPPCISNKIENDGLDLVANSDSSVDRCLVVTCDDAMCSKSSEEDAGIDNVAFTNNIVFSWCAGQKAGMQAESIHQNVVFRNNDVVQARRGLVAEITEGKETLHGVTFRDVRVEALVRTVGKSPQAVEINADTAAIRNISFFDVSITGVAAARQSGDQEGNVWIHGKSATKEYVEGVHFHGLHLDGELILNAKAANLTAENANAITFDKN